MQTFILIIILLLSEGGKAWSFYKTNRLLLPSQLQLKSRDGNSKKIQSFGPIMAAATAETSKNGSQNDQQINPYLQCDDVVDWEDPTILELAKKLRRDTHAETAKVSFEWVRDEIYHSVDYKRNPVTCSASQVLKQRTGFCYAKSHLLAALLRANGIPTGFCYQRLSVNDNGAPYCLHGLNAVYLEQHGWYKVDPRGNNAHVDAQFIPPKEQLAYEPRLEGEIDFNSVLSKPLDKIVKALNQHDTWEDLCKNLPDVSPQGESHT